MGFLDKVKAGAEQAAARAKVEMHELQTKRELTAAYGELGQSAFELVESGAVSHEQLTAGAERIRALKAQLAELEAQEPSEAEPASTTAEPAASGQPPAMPT
jgi:hypothetical protein